MNLDAPLSPNFSLRELVVTSHREFLPQQIDPGEKVLGALRALCRTILEPIRTNFGKPLVVHSGYRCPDLNRVVGGASNSQHMVGEAADFHVAGVPLVSVFSWIERDSGLAYGQVVLEPRDYPVWVHISLGEPYRPFAECRQAFRMNPKPPPVAVA